MRNAEISEVIASPPASLCENSYQPVKTYKLVKDFETASRTKTRKASRAPSAHNPASKECRANIGPTAIRRGNVVSLSA